MYFIFSVVLFLGGLLHLNRGGDFDQFWKLIIASGLFGLCDSITSCSLKSFLYTYKSMYQEWMSKKGSTKDVNIEK